MTQNSTESVHEQLPFTWRVTRYDPSRRDAQGSYVGDTWTSVADVGKTYGASKLTIEAYECVEATYVETFAAFADESGIDRLQIRAVDFSRGALNEGVIVDVDEAKTVLRAMLREEASCKLEAPSNDFYAHVGFDLYMYIGSAQPCPSAIVRATRLGLYIDAEWPSPMLPARR
jgi:hypothetical protein